MLKTLRIDNFVLIDRVEIDLYKGFTVVTGETGSGKSILLNALNLILGERADFSVIGPKKDKAIVEAEIDVSSFELKSFFERNDLDYFENTILRREIYKQGRSRAFINDVPVGLNQMKEFASGLIHIHSQYNTLDLKSKEYQLYVLDVLADNLGLREEYYELYKEWTVSKRKLSTLTSTYNEQVAAKDYNDFQLQELEDLNLDNIDFTALEVKLSSANNAEDIQESYSAVVNALESEAGVIDQLTMLLSALSRKKDMDAKLLELYERISSVKIELQDLVSEAQDSADSMMISEEDVALLSEQIDNFNRILAKHNVANQEGLIELRKNLSTESESTDKLKSEIEELERKIIDQEDTLGSLSERLRMVRVEAVDGIEDALQNKLSNLKLEGTTLEFRMTELNELSEYGKDFIEIYFSPNKGSDPVPVHRAASGGELSRVMLALQDLMCQKVQLKSVLFDEIDTGVSGDVAQRIGDTLRSMGEKMQVIAITHLPQVAARGEDHYKVTKSEVDGRVQTNVRKLNESERVEEVARLMSGDIINDAALENAKALMV